MKRFEYLDSLRGIAILLVLLAHTSFNAQFPSFITDNLIIKVGPSGVQLFYLLSAFTLSLTYTRHVQKEKKPLRNFYIRRFFRIAPLFYLVLLYTLIRNDFFGVNPSHFSLAKVLTTITFTNGFFPQFINSIVFGQWSIADEALFYVLFPFLFYHVRSFKKSLSITITSLFIAQVLRLFLLQLPFVMKSTMWQSYTFEFFISQLPIFLMGMTLFLFMKDAKNVKKMRKLLWMSSGILFILLFFQFIFHSKVIAGHYTFGIFFVLLLYYLAHYSIKLFVNPLISYIGRISFGLYLTHIFVLAELSSLPLYKTNFFPPILEMLFRFSLLVLFSSMVATVLYFCIELPGQALGKKIIYYFEEKG